MSAEDAWNKYWVEGASFKETAAELGVAMNTLYKLWDRWGFPKRKPGPRRREGSLTEEQVREILDCLEGGWSQAELAREYGVSRQRINQISRQLFWRTG